MYIHLPCVRTAWCPGNRLSSRILCSCWPVHSTAALRRSVVFWPALPDHHLLRPLILCFDSSPQSGSLFISWSTQRRAACDHREHSCSFCTGVKEELFHEYKHTYVAWVLLPPVLSSPPAHKSNCVLEDHVHGACSWSYRVECLGSCRWW